jgi:hypothetical protein
MPYLQFRAGFYRVRMPVPKHLQEIIGRGSRLTRALHTADREEADRLSLPVVAEFMDIIAAAEAEYQKSKLPMEWGWVVDQEEPITFFDYEIGQTRTITFPPGMKRGWVKPGTQPPGSRSLKEVDGMPGYPSISLALKRMAENSPASAEKITMPDLIALWVAERQVPIGSQRNYTRKVKRLVDFLGHDDPTRITDRDMIRYKEHLLRDPGLSQPTVAAHLDDLRTIFRFAARNKKVSSDPLADVTFKAKRDPHRKRLPFSADDRKLILAKARQADPVIRWTAWLGAFSGMRLGEIVEAGSRDIVQLEGYWVFRVGYEHRDTTIKTETSLRDVPIHSAIIREGFLDYVSALKPGPLFPMIAMVPVVWTASGEE